MAALKKCSAQEPVKEYNVIQFPVQKTETKVPNMSCCKTQSLEWNFNKSLF